MKTFKHVFRYLVYWSRSHLGVFNVSSDRRRFFVNLPRMDHAGVPQSTDVFERPGGSHEGVGRKKKSLESTDVRHEGDGYDGCCMWMKTFRHA